MIKITKKGNKAWVTFTILPKEGESVVLCGEWSEWKDEVMKVKKSGAYYLTKVLKTDCEYQFGYRINGAWLCDETTECVVSPYASENSLLKL